MKARLVLIAVALILAVAICGGLALAAEDALYVCNCDDCKCKTVSVYPGKCECGKDLVSAHVLKIAENKATLCLCGKDCVCKIDQADPSKCGCGKAAKVVDLKGLYVCSCGAGCCNTVSDKPGKCKCGKDLNRV